MGGFLLLTLRRFEKSTVAEAGTFVTGEPLFTPSIHFEVFVMSSEVNC